MLTKISTIDYYGTESIDLNNDIIILKPDKFEKILEIIKSLVFYFGTRDTVKIPETTEDSFIINLFIDNYQVEFYAERLNFDSDFGYSVQNIYQDGNLVIENIGENRNISNYNVFIDFNTKINNVLKNSFTENNIEDSLYTIKNKYEFDVFGILNKFTPYLFEGVDSISINGISKSGYTLPLSCQGSGFLSFINLIPMMCEAIRTNSTVFIDRYTNFHPILKKAIFEVLWKEKTLHKLMNEDESKGQIVMRDYEYGL